MRELHIDPSRLITSNLDPITIACFESREILGSYMEEGVGLGDYIKAATTEHADISYIGEVDDGSVTVHETTPVPVNDNQCVYLSNIPYTYDTQKQLEPITEPGYVALRDTIMSEDSAYGPHDDAAQYIFRLPVPQLHGAAIFEGWRMDVSEEITLMERDKLKQVRNLLRILRGGLRTQLMTDPLMYDELYHSHVPRPSVASSFEEMLRAWPQGE